MKFLRIRRFPPRPADFRSRSAPQYPYNELPSSPELSEPRYGIKVYKNCCVKMSDGLKVYVDIYCPDKEGKYPALFAMSPYTKEMQGTDSPSLCNEAGDMEFFVKRGYVYVVADSRGSGNTGGKIAFFNDREAQDGTEIVNWIGAQTFCNGNVGMIGMSYFAIVQLLIAKKKPTHLKCIFAYDPIYDLYRDCCYHGGKFSIFPILWAYFIAINHIFFPREKGSNGKKINWRSFLFSAFPFITQRHKFDDDWMRERSGFWSENKLNVPTYIGSGWEYSVGLHLRGVFDVFWQAVGPKRMLIGPPQVPLRPYSSWRIESLRWYDYWLKGMNTGIDNDAPVNIWIMGRNKWRAEQEWPITRTKYTKLYLRPDEGKRKIGQLSLTVPDKEEKKMSYLSWPFSLAHLGLPQLVYRTPVLRSNVEVTGHILLKLYASCSAKDTSFIVKLCDEDEDGSFRVLTKGWLKASHREVDEKLSSPYRPFHPHRSKEKLKRKKVYEYLIEIWPISNLFITGHRIRLEIACAESLYYDFPYTHFPSPNIGRIKIQSSPEYQSVITLPIVDSELNLENTKSNIKFEDSINKYFATKGKDKVFDGRMDL